MSFCAFLYFTMGVLDLVREELVEVIWSLSRNWFDGVFVCGGIISVVLLCSWDSIDCRFVSCTVVKPMILTRRIRAVLKDICGWYMYLMISYKLRHRISATYGLLDIHFQRSPTFCILQSTPSKGQKQTSTLSTNFQVHRDDVNLSPISFKALYHQLRNPHGEFRSGENLESPFFEFEDSMMRFTEAFIK